MKKWKRFLGKLVGMAILAARSSKDIVCLMIINFVFFVKREKIGFFRPAWLAEIDLTDAEVCSFFSQNKILDLLSERVFFKFYEQSIKRSFFKAAQYAKEKGALKTGNRKMAHAGTWELFEITKACIYSDNYEKAVHGTSLLMSRGLETKRNWDQKELRAFAFLLDGDISSAQKIWDEQIPSYPDTDAFFDFKNYCRNKTVAIVGPADLSVDRSQEIDSNDIVVRINHFISKPISKIGEKTNVVYYNGEVTRENWQVIQSELSYYDFVILRGGVDNKILSSEKKILQLPQYNVLFRAGLMGIQRIFLDIIRHTPKAITLYNVDFYTGKKAYSDGYIGAARRRKLAVTSLQRHDLVQNFLMMKKLYDKGFLDADNKISEILSLDKAGYIEKLSTYA